jgi:hypothetical protein
MSEADVTITVGADAAQEFVNFAQDRADGAALRRLREALPREGHVVVFSMSELLDRPWGAQAYIGDEIPAQYKGVGRTIAEAADKCREALG